ncbi:hypothetical protein ACFY8B_23835 [Streptomyces sp. NPDC012751]|uniref:hypothetical protein n=1 Tax=Streptomyces sp. NPDC012751 TaxID=3364846 RepID=UPI0036CB2EA2
MVAAYEAASAAAAPVRIRDLVRVDSQEELARRYPRATLVLPYRFALAGAPIQHHGTVVGALLLRPGPRQGLGPAVTAGIASVCAFLGHVPAAAERTGQPIACPRVGPSVCRAAQVWLDRFGL